jgi:hypothetical protein
MRDAAFRAAGVREISFGGAYPVKLREMRGREARLQREGGWTGWALCTAWEPGASSPP